MVVDRVCGMLGGIVTFPQAGTRTMITRTSVSYGTKEMIVSRSKTASEGSAKQVNSRTIPSSPSSEETNRKTPSTLPRDRKVWDEELKKQWEGRKPPFTKAHLDRQWELIKRELI